MTKRILTILATAFLLMSGGTASAADEFEQAPIRYSATEPENVISELQELLDEKKVELTYDPQFGYLKSLLEKLKVPVDTQMLVFSKTSLQIGRISPRTPRALYFNDDIYIGYAHGGDLIEISAVDPVLGTVFYTLKQDEIDPPHFIRQVDRCLTCHATTRTEYVPGHIARSLHVDRRGFPIFSAGSKNVDHRTPIEERWGGWYVTGTHGKHAHLGNLISNDRDSIDSIDNSEGQNVTSLEGRFNLDRYLTPHSDIVSLMVFEHQLMVHNQITKSGFGARQALHYRETMTAALGKETDTLKESVERRIRQASDNLVKALLFVNEAPINHPIQGTSGFAERFTKSGISDKQGRSLKQLDLQQRLFRYPMSYVIYSPAFDALPEDLLENVWSRLHAVLTGADNSEEFAHLSPEDRQAILEILLETKPNLPDSWRAEVTKTGNPG
ncbi:MAG TPA: hypothetical protein VNQ76_20050 [Planctomicrobium sp.]|nr:hypothetical protein [Planctomicrobium sp.]